MTYINYFFTCIKMGDRPHKRRRSDTRTYVGAESKTTKIDLLKAIRDGKKMFELTSGKKLGRNIGSGSFGAVFAIQDQDDRCVKIEIITNTNTEEKWMESLTIYKRASEIGCGPRVYDMFTHPLCVSANQEQVCFGYIIMKKCSMIPYQLSRDDFWNIFSKIHMLGNNRLVCFDLKPKNMLTDPETHEFYITDYGSQFCYTKCPPGTEKGYIFLMQLVVGIVFHKKGYNIPDDLIIKYMGSLCDVEALSYREKCYKIVNWYVQGNTRRYRRTQTIIEFLYNYAKSNSMKANRLSTLVMYYMNNLQGIQLPRLTPEFATLIPPPPPAHKPTPTQGGRLKF